MGGEFLSLCVCVNGILCGVVTYCYSYCLVAFHIHFLSFYSQVWGGEKSHCMSIAASPTIPVFVHYNDNLEHMNKLEVLHSNGRDEL